MAAVWLRGGGTLSWVGADGRVLHREPIDEDRARAADLIATRLTEVPAARWSGWRRRSGQPDALVSPELGIALRAAGLAATVAPEAAVRAARAALPVRPVAQERELLLAVGLAAARRGLSDPEESLIALAREETRVERALGRELAARSQWVPLEGTVLGAHADSQDRFAETFTRYHAELADRLDAAARASVPNLATLVGPKVAARLLAAAGSRATLARISGARLQLLGARRRPRPDGGPRFGVLFRAPGIEELPESQRGRFARSLAALAVIAVRADHSSGRDLTRLLLERRDRRWAELRRRRS